MDLNALWYKAIVSRYGPYTVLSGFQVVVPRALVYELFRLVRLEGLFFGGLLGR